jgi:site-specific DNA-adenine methylase
MSLRPPVGYKGGKRRLLKRLRPFFPVDAVTHYVEPFVGMGAMYLDLRDRGYEGSAVLADSNPQVADFWRYVHGDPDYLVRAVDRLESWPRTAEGYGEMLKEACEDEADRVARFLWITNFAFGNEPPAYRGNGWTNTHGTKLTSAERWGKTFPWDDCVQRLIAVINRVEGRPVVVLADAADALTHTTPTSHTYADPPYVNHGQYHGKRGDFTTLIATAQGHVVLSEGTDLATALGSAWAMSEDDVVARLSDQTGANGKRREYLYVKTPIHTQRSTLLPTDKNVPGVDPLNKKTLLYGQQKVGKSTLVSQLYPDAVYFATDTTGLEELGVFTVPIRDWTEFRKAGAELAQYARELVEGATLIYEAVVVDTVDELVRQCRQHVLAGLTGGPVKKAEDFLHESDWDYGKAWSAVAEEFRIRVAKLCSLGLPVVFVSHSKMQTKKNRTGQEITVQSPDIGSGQLREWLLKFVDYIFFAEIIGSEEGDRRVLHTAPSESYHAGYRWPQDKEPLPATLPLDGRRLRAALVGAAQGKPEDNGEVEAQASPTKPVRKPKAKPAKEKAGASA